MGGRMLGRIGFIGLVIVLAWLMGGVVEAEVYYVPDDYLTIQEAIDAAQDGDEIIVRAGTYYENIYFNGKAVYLHSEAGPDVTVIDGMRLGSVVMFDMGEGEGSIIEGFTITNGVPSGIVCYGSSPTIRGNIITGNRGGYYGGGIYCANSSSPTIEGNVITGNNTYYYGGGIYCLGSSPIIVNNTISANTIPREDTGRGGGIYCENSTPTIRGNIITGNGGGYYGGGIYCYNSSATIEGNEITGNNAYKYGGGVYCTNSSPVMVNNTISDNTIEYTAGQGGGIYCYNSAPMIQDSVIMNNDKEGIYCSGCELRVEGCEIAGNTGWGIDIYSYSASSIEIRDSVIRNNNDGGIRGGNLVIDNCEIKDNTTSGSGGGIYAVSKFTLRNSVVSDNSASSSGGGIYLSSSTATITNSEISRNTSTYAGGGIYYSGSSLTIMNSKIRDNESNVGGGIYLRSGTATITNSEISGNRAGSGGGVYLYSGSLTMTNCVLSGNDVSGYGGGIYCYQNFHFTMTNCIVSWNSSGQGGGIYVSSSSADITYSDFYGNITNDIYGTYPGIGCIFYDPQFVDADAGDYRLMPGSFCRDRGNPDILDPDGTRSDMGMYGGPDAGWTAFSVPFGTGWNLVAVSGRSVYGDMVEGVFDDLVQGGNVMEYNVFAYQEIEGAYLVYPDDFTNIEEGRGYWLNAQIGGEYVMRVFESSEPEERVALSQGWNLIGNPYSGDVGLAGLYVEHPTEGRVGFEEAVARGWIVMPMFGYDPQGYYFTVALEGGDYDYLMAWHGYWVLATVDGLELVIPKP